MTYAQVGDEINIQWELPKGIQYVVIGPFTTKDAVSQEYDEDGFNIEPTKRGFYIGIIEKI